MTVADLTPIQLYCLIMTAFAIIMGAGQLLKMIPDLDSRQKVVAYTGLFGMVIGPALMGAWVLAK